MKKILTLLLALGLAAMFTLGTASTRFDTAYDNGTDLSNYYFQKLEEGQSYNLLQKVWLGIARHRIMPILAAILVFVVFVALNRELLYSQKIAPYVFVLPFLLTFAVFFVVAFWALFALFVVLFLVLFSIFTPLPMFEQE